MALDSEFNNKTTFDASEYNRKKLLLLGGVFKDLGNLYVNSYETGTIVRFKMTGDSGASNKKDYPDLFNYLEGLKEDEVWIHWDDPNE